MKSSFLACLLSVVLSQLTAAQEPPEMPEPTKQHQWLKKFVGRWEVTGKGVMGEGQPEMETTATIRSQMVGGFWVVNTMNGEASGTKFRGIQTLGYDAEKKKYVGTWIDSMNGHMWKYEGTVDESGQKLVLDTTGPDMMEPGKTRKYRDAYEFKSNDTMIATSSMQTPDGKWMTFMTSTAKRQKGQRGKRNRKAADGAEKEKKSDG